MPIEFENLISPIHVKRLMKSVYEELERKYSELCEDISTFSDYIDLNKFMEVSEPNQELRDIDWEYDSKSNEHKIDRDIGEIITGSEFEKPQYPDQTETSFDLLLVAKQQGWDIEQVPVLYSKERRPKLTPALGTCVFDKAIMTKFTKNDKKNYFYDLMDPEGISLDLESISEILYESRLKRSETLIEISNRYIEIWFEELEKEKEKIRNKIEKWEQDLPNFPKYMKERDRKEEVECEYDTERVKNWIDGIIRGIGEEITEDFAISEVGGDIYDTYLDDIRYDCEI